MKEKDAEDKCDTSVARRGNVPNEHRKVSVIPATKHHQAHRTDRQSDGIEKNEFLYNVRQSFHWPHAAGTEQHWNNETNDGNLQRGEC